MKMNRYLHNLFNYFDLVLNPAEGKGLCEKRRKKRSKVLSVTQASPERFDSRAIGSSKDDKLRRNPAP
jgi:hypothetical protein